MGGFLPSLEKEKQEEVKGKAMRKLQATDGLDLYPVREKKTQSAMKSKEEAAKTSLSEMLEYLCSPHRVGRYRQCSLESDVEYLRWFLNES
jgi:hypothetical protein